jgi:hypothetical protein
MGISLFASHRMTFVSSLLPLLTSITACHALALRSSKASLLLVKLSASHQNKNKNKLTKAEQADPLSSRRQLLLATGYLLTASTQVVHAETGSTKKKPTKQNTDEAFANLLKAREERVRIKTSLGKRDDVEAVRRLLQNDATSLRDYETNAGTLLSSKRLTYV